MNRALFIMFIVLLIPALVNAQKKVAHNSNSKAIIQTSLDYAEGYYGGEPERMERTIHPDFNKVSLMFLPNSESPVIYYSSWSGLIAACKSKSGYLEPKKRKLDASVLDNQMTALPLTSYLLPIYLSQGNHPLSVVSIFLVIL